MEKLWLPFLVQENLSLIFPRNHSKLAVQKLSINSSYVAEN